MGGQSFEMIFADSSVNHFYLWKIRERRVSSFVHFASFKFDRICNIAKFRLGRDENTVTSKYYTDDESVSI